MIRRLGAAVALAILVACTSATTGPSSSPITSSPAPSPPAGPIRGIPTVRPGGAPTLQAAIARLCVPPSIPGGTPASGTLPPDLADIVHQLEVVRGHTFTSPPHAEAVTDQEMDRRLAESFAAYYPESMYDRRTFAWRTIGVIGPTDDLYQAYAAYFQGQVIGFYDPETGELVYLGSGDLGFQERLTLAHELTHALDDQTFDLKRLDALSARCQDERGEAALGLVEGSAQYFGALTVAQDPQIDLGDLLSALADALSSGAPPPGVPAFVDALQVWPYVAGQSFVTQLATAGTGGVDRAFEHLPASTEQVIHPDAYPSERPVPVQIPDLTRALGPRWGDLDAMTIGEEWLRAMLALRLDQSQADDAAAGWGGGGYRAFTDGHDVVVALRTVWDTPADATAFAEALRNWSQGSDLVAVQPRGTTVTGTFVTSPRLLGPAAAALG